jgi:hypothetical protein
MDAVVFAKVKSVEGKVDILDKKIEVVNKIIDLHHTFTLVETDKYSLVSIPLGGGTNKLILKSVYIEGVENSSIETEIRSSANDVSHFIFYRNSVASNIVYDQIDLPFIDDDESDCLHLYVKNTGNVSSSFVIRITGMLAN